MLTALKRLLALTDPPPRPSDAWWMWLSGMSAASCASAAHRLRGAGSR